jgi:Flp pilus assembly pilin Flp
MNSSAPQRPRLVPFRKVRWTPGHLWRDQFGATLIEYTLLISIMLALISIGIASYTLWASGMWTSLTSSLSP